VKLQGPRVLTVTLRRCLQQDHTVANGRMRDEP
jgi:hypothetical protein